MTVREINVMTGVETVREYTLEEIAANKITAAEAAAQISKEPTKMELKAQVDMLQSKIDALP
jgi:hypothetical protein